MDFGRLVGRSRVARLTLVALVVGLCLYGGCGAVRVWGVLSRALVEVEAAVQDPGTQWMVALSAGMYCGVFGWIRWRIGREGGDGAIGWRAVFKESRVWLGGLGLAVSASYALSYTESSHSTQAVALFWGMAVGQGAGLWAAWSRRGGGEGNVARLMAAVFVLWLLVGALWHPEGLVRFEYRGAPRWSGPWDNPNLYGELMGVGLVLAAGLAAGTRTIGWKGRLQRWLWVGAGLALALGLVRSYSRGAWLGAAVGFGYLGMRWWRSTGPAGTGWRTWVERNRLALAVMVVAAVVLGFWLGRQTEWRPARRALSVGNVNDFSWRNRVSAWDGAVRMMADRPVTGFGWNVPERMYSEYYRSAKVSEWMAIQLNDYLTLGMAAGVPALACFVVYMGVGRRGRQDLLEGKASWAVWGCIAAAATLLVGFWFDGGLFKWPTGFTFWVLLELGREG